MGIFNLFKKKEKNNDDEAPKENEMLTLKERATPKKATTSQPKIATKPPEEIIAPEIVETPEPTSPALAGLSKLKPPTASASISPPNLQTKSGEKTHLDHVPSIKKLVIPSAEEESQPELEQTDIATSLDQLKPLKQVNLANKNDSLVPPATSNVEIGEGINIPVSALIGYIPAQFLVPDIQSVIRSTDTIRFNKDEILPILSQGVFAVVGGALLKRLPQHLVAGNNEDISEVFNIPLDNILPLVPPEWFLLQGQDQTLSESIKGMSNPFADTPEEAPTEDDFYAIPDSDDLTEQEDLGEVTMSEEEEIVSLSIEEEPELDPEETIIQEKIPTSEPVIDPEETIIQEKIPTTVASNSLFSDDDDDLPAEEALPEETIVQQRPPRVKTDSSTRLDKNVLSETTLDDVLKIPPEKIAHIIRSPHATMNIPKAKILSSLNEGNVNLSREELCIFAGITDNSIMSNDTVIDIGLAHILDIIPLDWLNIEGQDTQQSETINSMNNLFGEDFEESPAKEDEAKPEDNVTEAQAEETVNIAEEEAPEEEIINIVEEDTSPSNSLITGGMFGSKNLIFDDDDDDEDDIDIEIEDEPATTIQNFADEEEEIVNIVEEEAPEEEVVNIVEEEAPEEEIVNIVEEEAPEEEPPALIPPSKPAAEAPASLVAPVKQTEKPTSLVAPVKQVEKPTSLVAPVKQVESTGEKDSPGMPEPIKQTPTRPSLDGQIANASKGPTRPSTAPNGIDINRSNLKDLCQLYFAGEKLAQAIITYREENGPFERINDLVKVPGVGTSVYKGLTGLRPAADLVAAERRINKVIDKSTDEDLPLSKIVTAACEKFNFKSLILSDKDGFEICSTGDKSLLESNSELLAAATPQLFKKTKHFLKQANLPHPEVFTFYLEETPVTFGIADEVFLVMVHNAPYPEAKHMKQCRSLINELAWYCSFRAVL